MSHKLYIDGLEAELVIWIIFGKKRCVHFCACNTYTLFDRYVCIPCLMKNIIFHKFHKNDDSIYNLDEVFKV